MVLFKFYISLLVFYLLVLSIIERGIFHCRLEKEMATHSSTLAWKIPLTEEPGRL